MYNKQYEQSEHEHKVGDASNSFTEFNPSADLELVLLAPDVAKAFPTEEAVNESLRRLMQLQEAA